VTTDETKDENLNTKLYRNSKRSEAFLDFIIKNYMYLPKIVIFDLGGKEEKIERIESNYYFYSFGIGYDRDHMNVFPRDELGFRQWFREYVNNSHDIDAYVYIVKGKFFIRKEEILKKPKDYYVRLLQYSQTSQNAESEFYFERAWCYIFSHN
jgi:hypothetical protein